MQAHISTSLMDGRGTCHTSHMKQREGGREGGGEGREGHRVRAGTRPQDVLVEDSEALGLTAHMLTDVPSVQSTDSSTSLAQIQPLV